MGKSGIAAWAGRSWVRATRIAPISTGHMSVISLEDSKEQSLSSSSAARLDPSIQIYHPRVVISMKAGFGVQQCPQQCQHWSSAMDGVESVDGLGRVAERSLYLLSAPYSSISCDAVVSIVVASRNLMQDRIQ